jgi:hypothetical protein
MPWPLYPWVRFQYTLKRRLGGVQSHRKREKNGRKLNLVKGDLGRQMERLS